MKKFIASASLVAVGATGLHGAYAPGLTRTQTSKPWSVSGAIRGFYDDNYTTRPSNSPDKKDSFGFEIVPSVSVNLPLEQTYLGASYTFSMKYYEDRDKNNADYTHDFELDFDHRFNERSNIKLSDTFVYADEPELVDPNLGAPLRENATGFRNVARSDYEAMVTERAGFGVGYQNSWYDYDQSGTASRSALLDRVEQLIHLDGRYQIREHVIGVLGYQLGLANYTADELLFVDPDGPGPIKPEKSDYRDSTSHYFYLGADANLTSQLSASGRIGVQYADFYNANESSVSPYVDLAATYTYLPGSYFRLGIGHFRNATDASGSVGDVTIDQESTRVYGLINHKITPRVTGNLLAQFQHSTFSNGQFDGDADDSFLVGVNLDYEINQHLTAEAGYNFDRLDSDLPDRSFTRNRVFVGLRATY
jgi:Putative beta-barrel porin 2